MNHVNKRMLTCCTNHASPSHHQPGYSEATPPTRLLLTLWMVVFMLGLSTGTQAVEEPGDRSIWSPQVRQRAIEQVLASSRSSNPFLRANAVEAAQALPRRVVPLLQLALEDPHPSVRFAALAMIGKLRLSQMAPAAERFLGDRSESVQAAARYAMFRCHQPVDMTPLAEMLTSQNPSLRGNVAMLMGMTGDPSAVAMLKDLAQTPMPRASAVQEALVRIQIAEAIVMLGNNSALDAVRAAAYSPFDEVRVMAVIMMGRLGDLRMQKAVAQMLDVDPIELRIAAAGTLAQLGQPQGLKVVLRACKAPFPTARAQAASTLRLFDDKRVDQAIQRLLDDPDELVRLSAAASILDPHTDRQRLTGLSVPLNQEP